METQTPREPFVSRFLQDVAEGFLVAGVLGSAYHYAKGGFQAICKSVPRGSCSTALFFGAYGAIERAMVSARRKEEPVLDCAVASGGANGVINLHRGLRFAGQSTLLGFALGGVAMAGIKLLEGQGPSVSVSPPAKQPDDPGLRAPAFFPTLPVEIPWTPPAQQADDPGLLALDSFPTLPVEIPWTPPVGAEEIR